MWVGLAGLERNEILEDNGVMEMEGLERKAKPSGASQLVVKDLKEEFVRDYIFPCLRAGTVYERKYLLGTSMARPVIAKTMVDVAKEVGVDVVAHGCTGKGNDQSFSAVVGPNGSRKSNVIDAVLFVLWKACKTELIHNSSNHQNLERTEVSVHFQEIIDLGEVEQISLMKPKAQGPHDEGFLEYLEDIIGTHQYVEKIDEENKQFVHLTFLSIQGFAASVALPLPCGEVISSWPIFLN